MLSKNASVLCFLALAVPTLAAETCSPGDCASADDVGLLQVHQEGLSLRDLARAKKVVPGEAFMAAHGETNEMLNKHMLRLTGGKAKPCEEFSMAELEKVTREIDAKAHPALQQIHETNRHPTRGEDWKDPRSLEGASLHSELGAFPAEHVQAARLEKACYDAAMRFTHSVPDKHKPGLLAGHAIPLLPKRAARATNALFQAAGEYDNGGYTGDVIDGQWIFEANCEMCHWNGKNKIIAKKDLKLGSLERNSMASEGAIRAQVREGKRAMPPFGNVLTEEEIDDVAEYVIEQAENDWFPGEEPATNDWVPTGSDSEQADNDMFPEEDDSEQADNDSD